MELNIYVCAYITGQMFVTFPRCFYSLIIICITVLTQLEKRPVAECEKHLDCQSCLLAHDPYCGWCVLEGK